MPEGHDAVTGPPPNLQHLDWSRAVANHQNEEKLRAFLVDYPADLRKIIGDMREALAGNDMERLREAAQRVMGSSSYVAAQKLSDFARDLVEAIDLEEEQLRITDLAQHTAAEAEELEKEISGLKLGGGNADEKVNGLQCKVAQQRAGSKGCCCIL
eukprot:gnl/TRDRNA2_/TRDRNA2_182275_c0_seq1.p1 gnl/TRDRNA2_/TRDRNA2_182275_c0~~gnl/TRDRNA2_/TRDRNA2_182275_c0_seq1.p1  ORF type:complete len:156 (-),score=53.88 gnl/TRDRNA2_/TRDRNA2_182275_c0_seq1:95-562(-)